MRWTLLLAVAAIAAASPVLADPWRDESGHGWRGRGGWKQEYWDGGCRIERKWNRKGGYKEKVDCERPWAMGYAAPPVIVYREPVRPSFPPLPAGPVYGEVFQDGYGQYCREYQATGIIDGRPQRLYGTACLQPDGSWSFRN